MVRLALDPAGALVVDLRARLGGRGAWIHARATCLRAVEANAGRLGRSLHARPDTSRVTELVREAVLASCLDGLSFAAAAGALVGGRDLLARAIKDRQVVGVVVAHDASDRNVDEYRAGADDDIAFTVVPLDTVDLGARVGKGPRAALGVRSSAASAHLLRQLRRLRDLG